MAEREPVTMRVMLDLAVQVDPDITEEAMKQLAVDLLLQAESAVPSARGAVDDFYLVARPEVSDG